MCSPFYIQTVIRDDGRTEFVLVNRITGERVFRGEYSEVSKMRKELEEKVAA